MTQLCVKYSYNNLIVFFRTCWSIPHFHRLLLKNTYTFEAKAVQKRIKNWTIDVREEGRNNECKKEEIKMLLRK